LTTETTNETAAVQETSEPPDKPKYPGTWRWGEDGDVVEGAYVELSEAHTRFDGETRPILTEADGPGRPSNPPRVLDGQIDIFGRIHRRDVQSELDLEAER
jgi:hypothetical protein